MLSNGLVHTGKCRNYSPSLDAGCAGFYRQSFGLPVCVFVLLPAVRKSCFSLFGVSVLSEQWFRIGGMVLQILGFGTVFWQLAKRDTSSSSTSIDRWRH